MEAQLRSQQEVSEQQEARVVELQALVESQEEQLAEVPKYLDRMRQAKEVRGMEGPGRMRAIEGNLVLTAAPHVLATPYVLQRIKEFMDRMRGGQQQLEELQAEVASRDHLVGARLAVGGWLLVVGGY